MPYTDRLIDKRVVERNLHKGLVDIKTLNAQIQSLPDQSDNVQPFDTLDDDDDDQDDDDNE